MATKKEKKPHGRPTLFTQEIADKICKELEKGQGLRRACRENEDFPHESTVRKWTKENPEFYTQYTSAREIGYEAMADELLDISDGEKEDSAADRDRLRLDTRKWLLSKIYGDKTSTEITGKDGEPIQVQDMEAARRVAFMLGKAVGAAAGRKEDA
jgi:hypothetical protein